MSTAIHNLNADVEQVSRWCCQNSLLINPGKTKVLMIGMPQLLNKLPTASVRMLGKEIASSAVAKDLGIYIDQSLTYNEHIAKTVSTCLHKLVQINRIKHLLDKKTILLLMSSFVFSKLYYCSTAWSHASKHNIDKLQLVQNFAARVDHISHAIKSLNWLPVNDRTYLNDAVMMYKCINKLVPDYLFEKFTLRSQIDTRNTRQRDQLNIPRCRRATGQRSFTYRGAKLWNNLRDNVKSSDSVKGFGKKIVNLLFSDQSMNL